jgi:nucleoside 2-deoxyribosyltransferase
MAKPKQIYLACPEIFFPATEHQTIVGEKKRLLREYGFEGVDPLDTELVFSDGEAKLERGHRIYQANRELMDSCDAIIANLTPFRGISADPGTVYEVGHTIEDFEMSDNLMVEGGISDSGGQLFVAEQPGEHQFFSTELFRRCVQALADT